MASNDIILETLPNWTLECKIIFKILASRSCLSIKEISRCYELIVGSKKKVSQSVIRNKLDNFIIMGIVEKKQQPIFGQKNNKRYVYSIVGGVDKNVVDKVLTSI